MRRILEEFPAGRRKAVVLNFPLPMPWEGLFHGDLMAKAVDSCTEKIVLQIAYDDADGHAR